MEQARSPGVFKAAAASDQWEKPYRPLPHLSLAFSLVWTLLACIWAINTWTKRRFQVHPEPISIFPTTFCPPLSFPHFSASILRLDRSEVFCRENSITELLYND
jgi:hypothetical protein